MFYVSEKAVEASVTQDDVNMAIESVFKSLAAADAVNFPVVREILGYADAIFGFKSGFDRSGPTLGVKAGGLWPGNRAKGMANHQSTIVLFDPETGGPYALVRGTYLTALRTAAASALSIRALARNDSEVLGIVGAGGQASFQVKAALQERPFKRLMVFDSSTENAKLLCKDLSDTDLDIEVADAKAVAEASDVIITVTPSFEPILSQSWIKPGTHLACMGADTKGKQEVETGLVASASLFGDEAQQAITLGECQHAYEDGLIQPGDILTLGEVLSGSHVGRQGDDDITIFDSTGMGLQDLAAAVVALKAAQSNGQVVELED
ncbi:MAG: ornithine cyclodeaminase family protein [Pseudomonadota bacterium]